MEPIKIYKRDKDKLSEIVREFCSTVYSTMGPGGKNVIIDNGDIVPLVTKDGVTVAEAITYKDLYKNAIASLIKEAARKTGNEVGDGTTTSTLLTERIIINGLDYIDKLNINKYEFFEALDEAAMLVTEYLSDSIVEVESDVSILESIVKISTNSDEAITKLIMKAVNAAGADGIINVKKTDDQISSVDLANGASINSKVFIDKNIDAEEADIVLIEGPVTDVNEVIEILRYSSNVGRLVIVVAKEFDERVLKILQVNRSQYKANVIAVEAEGFGSNRAEILNLLSQITAAPLYSTEHSTAINPKDFISSNVGTIYNVNITPSEVVFTPPEILSLEEVNIILTGLKEAYNKSKTIPNSAVSAHIKRKLSKFSNIATINVGGATEGEVIEREARITDAVCAVSSAVNGGVLPGGGRALQCASKSLVRILEDETASESKKGAFQCIFDACNAPIRVLCSNVGTEWEMIKNQFLFDSETKTIDLITLEEVDAFESGILDPALVSINAIKNSVSVAKTILRTNYSIIPDIDG